LGAAGTAGVTLAYAFGQRALEGHPEIANPFGIPGATALEAAFLLLPPASLAAAVSLLVRFRGATGEARQQLKWFAAGAAVAAVGVLASVLIGIAGNDAIANTVVLDGIACLPVATGVAILRYRLYDIDRLINRTLVYGLLTASLGCSMPAPLQRGQDRGGVQRPAPRRGRPRHALGRAARRGRPDHAADEAVALAATAAEPPSAAVSH
jgi:hypothetical protein